MNDDLAGLLGGLLSNPESIKKLMGSISNGESQPREEATEHLPMPPDLAQLTSGRDDRRINLLTALKPYLSSSRSANVDKAIRLLRLTKLTETFRNEGK